MGLPSVGPLELIIVLAVALVIVGPRRLPEMGSALGRTIREFRDGTAGLSNLTDAPAPAAQPPAGTPPAGATGDGTTDAAEQA